MNILGKPVEVALKRHEGLDGWYEDGVIYIHPESDHTHVLIHEMVHAVIDRLRISDQLGAIGEEVLCECIAITITENFHVSRHQ